MQKGSRASSGVGTLREKTLHAVLKRYYEPHSDNHEITVGRYVADIVGEDGIIEIQTADFSRLKDKLSAFLEVCPVTVVHPVAQKRRLRWIDKDSGEISDARGAPCRDPRADISLELIRIRELLGHPNLRFCFPLLEIEELRYLNPKQKNPHKKAARCDKIPTRLLDEWWFCSPKDYQRFLPACLPKQFVSRDYAKAAGCALSTAQLVLNLLSGLGLTVRIGKQGRSYLYELPSTAFAEERILP